MLVNLYLRVPSERKRFLRTALQIYHNIENDNYFNKDNEKAVLLVANHLSILLASREEEGEKIGTRTAARDRRKKGHTSHV